MANLKNSEGFMKTIKRLIPFLVARKNKYSKETLIIRCMCSCANVNSNANLSAFFII